MQSENWKVVRCPIDSAEREMNMLVDDYVLNMFIPLGQGEHLEVVMVFLHKRNFMAPGAPVSQHGFGRR